MVVNLIILHRKSLCGTTNGVMLSCAPELLTQTAICTAKRWAQLALEKVSCRIQNWDIKGQEG